MKAISEPSEWYTTQFIKNSLKHYLENQGFRLSEADQEQPLQIDKVIVATKLLSKEVIEIKGTLTEIIDNKTEEQMLKKAGFFKEATDFLSDLLLSPISFLTAYNGDEKGHCLCLPDIRLYREILEKVSEYFTSNQLHFKFYLVNQQGSVHVFSLNSD